MYWYGAVCHVKFCKVIDKLKRVGYFLKNKWGWVYEWVEKSTDILEISLGKYWIWKVIDGGGGGVQLWAILFWKEIWGLRTDIRMLYGSVEWEYW